MENSKITIHCRSFVKSVKKSHGGRILRKSKRLSQTAAENKLQNTLLDASSNLMARIGKSLNPKESNVSIGTQKPDIPEVNAKTSKSQKGHKSYGHNNSTNVLDIVEFDTTIESNKEYNLDSPELLKIGNALSTLESWKQNFDLEKAKDEYNNSKNQLIKKFSVNGRISATNRADFNNELGKLHFTYYIHQIHIILSSDQEFSGSEQGSDGRYYLTIKGKMYYSKRLLSENQQQALLKEVASREEVRKIVQVDTNPLFVFIDNLTNKVRLSESPELNQGSYITDAYVT